MNLGRKWKRTSVLSLVFNGVQAVSAFIAILLALYAAFFTTLPELLERQLRSEVVATKEELTEVRRSKNRLEQIQDSLVNQNAALNLQKETTLAEIESLKKNVETTITERDSLREETKKLSISQADLNSQNNNLVAQRKLLSDEVEKLRVYRSAYSRDALIISWSRIAVLATYEIDMAIAVADVSKNYGNYLKWFKAQKAGNYSVEFPDAWFGIPRKPSLDVGGDDIALGELQARALNAVGGREGKSSEFEQFFHKWVETQILTSHGATALTPAILIDHIKKYPFLSDVLESERKYIENSLDKFLSENITNPDDPINVNFEAMPSVGKLENSGEQIFERTVKMKHIFVDFFKYNGAEFTVR